MAEEQEGMMKAEDIHLARDLYVRWDNLNQEIERFDTHSELMASLTWYGFPSPGGQEQFCERLPAKEVVLALKAIRARIAARLTDLGIELP